MTSTKTSCVDIMFDILVFSPLLFGIEQKDADDEGDSNIIVCVCMRVGS
jgi:hypothetical protein